MKTEIALATLDESYSSKLEKVIQWLATQIEQATREEQDARLSGCNPYRLGKNLLGEQPTFTFFVISALAYVAAIVACVINFYIKQAAYLKDRDNLRIQCDDRAMMCDIYDNFNACCPQSNTNPWCESNWPREWDECNHRQIDYHLAKMYMFVSPVLFLILAPTMIGAVVGVTDKALKKVIGPYRFMPKNENKLQTVIQEVNAALNRTLYHRDGDAFKLLMEEANHAKQYLEQHKINVERAVVRPIDNIKLNNILMIIAPPDQKTVTFASRGSEKGDDVRQSSRQLLSAV